MADTKISALTALDSFVTGDLLPMVDDPAGTPATKKATIDQVKTFVLAGSTLATWGAITPGTGVATALAVNVGSAGAFVTFNGALGTPSSGTLTNATGLPIAGLVASTSAAISVGTVELGHASDTTIARASAGAITVEGNVIYLAGGTDVPVTDGGTGRSTSTTAYGLIAAGTTATGAHQTLAAGATTEILVGGGASALPVWTTATGTGSPVRAGSPALTGTATVVALTASGLGTFSAGADITPAAAPSATAVGYLGAPQNIGLDSGNVTLALTDSGKHVYHSDANTRTLTIPANGSVAFQIGTVIVGVNENAAGVLTIAITTDTLRWGSSTGSRTVAANGTFSLLKVAATVWRLTGDGIT